ncbi:hypothetical protein Q5P01_022445 [Channa striata]|uniref:Uncharacterized protein n=1 Tax=Channa striata TaxID=64152 RepID=A0AA88IW66_CHASR|nr:hypothetical protein Q5P01_022445 [Channa striata]
MANQAERRCGLQHSVAVVLLLLSLAPNLPCFSLQRLSKKVQQDEVASEPAAMGIRNGHIFFNGKELDSQSGSSSPVATGNNGLVHVDSVQSDGPEIILGQTLQLETALADEAAWRRLNPTLLCGPTKMKLKVMGPGAAHLQLDTGKASSLPLIQVPKTCGYSMQQNALGLILVVPYNGCRVTQKNGFYMLPMSWLKTPVKLACPMLQSSDAAATITAQPATTAMPNPQQNPALYPYPYFPYYQYYPLHRPHHGFTTTVPPATTTTTAGPAAAPAAPPSSGMNPPFYPYPYFPYYQYYPLHRPHHGFTTTVPPATTTTTAGPAAAPAALPSSGMNPPFYPYPYFPYYQYYPLHRPHHGLTTTVPPATTTTTAAPAAAAPPSSGINPPFYPYPYFPYYQSYPLHRPHHGFTTTVPPATTTTTAAPAAPPSSGMNPPFYPYPYFPYYQSYPLHRHHHGFTTTVPPATTTTAGPAAAPAAPPSSGMNPPCIPIHTSHITNPIHCIGPIMALQDHCATKYPTYHTNPRTSSCIPLQPILPLQLS